MCVGKKLAKNAFQRDKFDINFKNAVKVNTKGVEFFTWTLGKNTCI